MTGSIDFKEAISYACGTSQRNAEQPKQTTLTAALAELDTPSTKRDTPIISKNIKESR